MPSVKFNEQQQRAIDSDSTNIEIIACPGSGKSTVVVARIKKLLSAGVSAYQFLVITFTRKAAGSLKDKLAEFLPERELNKMMIGTSHSFCLSVIKKWAEKIGYNDNLTIYDEVDRNDIVTAIIKDLGYKIKPDEAMSHFETLSYRKPDEKTEAYNVYREYLSRLKKFNALDYDLILIKAIWILKNCPDALKYYRDRYRFLFYDEFQDLATLEHELTLTMAIENSFVVGDPSQNIYSFRGTNIKYILGFKESHPDCEVINLAYNYRSTPEICEAANNLISNNVDTIKNEMVAFRKSEGRRPEVLTCLNDESALCSIISTKLSEGYEPKDIAILVRINRQLKPLRQALQYKNIPVQVVARDSYWQMQEIRDILAFMRVIRNPRDDFSMNRILSMPYLRIGGAERLKIKNEAITNDKSLFKSISTLNHDITSMFVMAAEIEDNRYTSAMSIYKTIANHSLYMKSLKSQNLSTKIESIGMMAAKIKKFEEGSPENTSLTSFLDSISIVSAIDSWDEKKDSISLMTMHCAKGLEWPMVIVAGCEDGLAPMLKNGEEGVEEERRLFYVAITRAENELILSRSLNRKSWGNKIVETVPSRFLKEMRGGE